MARPTPQLDAAVQRVGALRTLFDSDDVRVSWHDPRLQLEAVLAIAEASLAVAEALHGVVYVANANSV